MAIAPETGLLMGLAPGHASTNAGEEAESAFAQLLDVFAPLPHLPVVSTFYRDATGDPISAPAQLAGGALFGGPIGFLAALANLAVGASTGSDIGEHALAMLAGDETEGDAAPAADQLAGPDAPGDQLADAEAIVGTAPRIVPQRLSYPVPSLDLPPAAGPQSPATMAGAVRSVVPAIRRGPAQEPPPAGWLARTMAEATAMRAAQAAGTPAETHPVAQPWLPAAMQQALDKYEALARGRRPEPTWAGVELNG
ncbi:MAG: hypothetical protein EXQ97_02755 [Alphaproteobacteria bacterium]|nr:hypothetical protein [Alphaproteobacteria bacterium]